MRAIILAVLLSGCTVHHEVRWKNGLACRCMHGLISLDCYCVPFKMTTLPEAKKEDPPKAPSPSPFFNTQTVTHKCLSEHQR